MSSWWWLLIAWLLVAPVGAIWLGATAARARRRERAAEEPSTGDPGLDRPGDPDPTERR